MKDGTSWVIIIAIAIIVIAIVTLGYHENAKACEAKGGQLIKVANGYVCAKLELLTP